MECMPVGFVFLPSDQELVEFLIKKIEGGADHKYFESSPIFEWDLYGEKEPWDIWKLFGGMNRRPGGDDDDDDDDQDLYLFTKLKKVSKNGSRITRKVGSGTWSGAYSETICASASNIPIALKKHFRYENEERPEHDGAWIMHEFSLYNQEDQYCSFVLCRLRKKTKKNNNKFHHHHHLHDTNTNTKTNVKKMRLSSDHHQGDHDHEEHDLAGNNNNNNINNIQHEAAHVVNNNNNDSDDHQDVIMFSFAEIEALLMLPDQEAKTTTTTAANGAGHDDRDQEAIAIAEIDKFLFSEEPAQDIIQDNQFLGNWDAASLFGEYFNGNHPSSFGGLI